MPGIPMLRLTILSQTPEEVVLALDGRVAEAEVKVLEQEGSQHLRQVHRLVLDLEGVKYIDRAGIALLQRWAGERLALRGGSPFVRMMLQEHGLN